MTPNRSTRRALLHITPGFLRRWPLPKPDGARGKDGRGDVLVVGGSVEVPGAVILSATAALRVGAGRLAIATARPVAPGVGVVLPEARVIGLGHRASGELSAPGSRPLASEVAQHDAVLVGPGMGRDGIGAAGVVLRACLSMASRRAVVVDAGALDALSSLLRRPHGHDNDRHNNVRHDMVIATPHAEEMARFIGRGLAAVLRRPLETAREVASAFGIHVVMKGATTYIAPPDGPVLVNRAGSIGLGTSGSGDVLAGAIAGLAARGASPAQAAAWGVYLHAKAGDALASRVGSLGFLAREILDELPGLLHRLAH